MKLFLLSFAQILLYTLGIVTLCAVMIEICYRLCFLLMGRRAGRAYWIFTSAIGAPVHEAGHAIMCLLFGHRIEKIRWFPSGGESAMVEHSYNKKNIYATFGNLWIGLGPIFTILSMVLLILYLVYPVSMQTYRETVSLLLDTETPLPEAWDAMRSFLYHLVSEETRGFFIRLLSLVLLFSLSLHVRLSMADIRGMLPGLPGYLGLCAVGALFMALITEPARQTALHRLEQFAWIVASLFALLLLLSLCQLALLLLFRILCGILDWIRGDRRNQKKAPVDPTLLRDYRDRDWEDFRK